MLESLLLTSAPAVPAASTTGQAETGALASFPGLFDLAQRSSAGPQMRLPSGAGPAIDASSDSGEPAPGLPSQPDAAVGFDVVLVREDSALEIAIPSDFGEFASDDVGQELQGAVQSLPAGGGPTVTGRPLASGTLPASGALPVSGRPLPAGGIELPIQRGSAASLAPVRLPSSETAPGAQPIAPLDRVGARALVADGAVPVEVRDARGLPSSESPNLPGLSGTPRSAASASAATASPGPGALHSDLSDAPEQGANRLAVPLTAQEMAAAAGRQPSRPGPSPSAAVSAADSLIGSDGGKATPADRTHTLSATDPRGDSGSGPMLRTLDSPADDSAWVPPRPDASMSSPALNASSGTRPVAARRSGDRHTGVQIASMLENPTGVPSAAPRPAAGAAVAPSLQQQPEPDAADPMPTAVIRETAAPATSGGGSDSILRADLARLDPGVGAHVAAQIARQIQQGMGSGSLRIQLNPQELGPVDVKLRVEGDRVHVAIVAHQPGTRDLIENHLAGLKTALESGGLSLGDVDVRQGSPGERERADGSGAAYPDRRPVHAQAAQTPPASRSSGRLIDAFV